MAKKIALVIAHEGYDAVEYNVPKKMLEEAGYQVVTISNKLGKARATDGSTTGVDALLDKIDPINFDGIVFIGGPGALTELDNDLSYSVLQRAVMADKLVGGICSATRILAKSGALVAKTATGWNGDQNLPQIYNDHAVLYDDEVGVVRDGRIVTAEGATHAAEFARELMEVV